ncbi:hypothetical protein [Kribbella sp. NPDC050459]|uniref:hypothetical protein n=1 Tax=Kribbella sp. NPDC050459 TaxID=3155785 RepID=UPI00341147C8
MATLLEVMATLDQIPDDDPFEIESTIFARKPWTVDSQAIVRNEEVVDSVAPSAPAFSYLLEVDLAKEVIRVWSEWRDGAVPTSEEAAQAVIFYGEHDSYQPLA